MPREPSSVGSSAFRLGTLGVPVAGPIATPGNAGDGRSLDDADAVGAAGGAGAAGL